MKLLEYAYHGLGLLIAIGILLPVLMFAFRAGRFLLSIRRILAVIAVIWAIWTYQRDMPTLWTVTAAVTAWGVVALMIAASIGQLEHWRTSRMGRVGLSLLGKLVPLPVAVAAEAGLDGVTAAPIPMPEAEPTRPIAEPVAATPTLPAPPVQPMRSEAEKIAALITFAQFAAVDVGVALDVDHQALASLADRLPDHFDDIDRKIRRPLLTAKGEGAIKVGLTLNPAGDVAVQIVERDPAYVPPAPPAPPAPAPELLSDHPYGGVLTIEAERAQNRAADLANFQLAPLAPRDIAADKIAAITVFAGLAATAHGLTLAPPHDPSAMAILTAQLADEFEVAGVKAVIDSAVEPLLKAVIDSAVEPLLIATKARGARNLRIAVNPAGHLTLEDVR